MIAQGRGIGHRSTLWLREDHVHLYKLDNTIGDNVVNGDCDGHKPRKT